MIYEDSEHMEGESDYQDEEVLEDGGSDNDVPDGDGDEEAFWSEPFRGLGGILQGVTHGQIRQHLINCAVDSKLAESIFRKISNIKPAGASPLTRLRLRIQGSGCLGLDDPILSLSRVTDDLARYWLVIPHPNIDQGNELLVTGIQPTEQFMYSKVSPEKAHLLPKWLAPILRWIWPENPEIGDWRKEWHSMPLAD